VHIGGHISADLPALAGRLAELGVPLVEDAAHAHGSTLGGRPAGTFGHAAFSFFPTKVITTFEGGMAVTGEPALAAAFRSLRDQGKDGGGELHVLPGNSWRMTEAGAVLGLVQLGRFAAALRRRNDILDRYRSDLGDILRFPAVPAGDVVSGHKAIAFPRTGIDRAELRDGARRRGVNLAREVYAVPLHRQPVFADLVEKPSDFPVTDQFCREHVCLPLWTAMSDEQVDQVVEAVRRTAT
jgi:perosamine synthetase